MESRPTDRPSYRDVRTQNTNKENKRKMKIKIKIKKQMLIPSRLIMCPPATSDGK